MNCAWILDREKRQWVDLGIHTGACMTQPEICGAAGGAISVWLKVIEGAFDSGGIISSRANGFTGTNIFLHAGRFKYNSSLILYCNCYILSIN